MKSRNSLKLQIANTALLAAFTVAGSAVAQTLPKEGSYDFTSCYSDTATTVSFGKDHSSLVYERTGMNTSNPPRGYMDKSTFRCVGMTSSFGGKNSGSSTCESIDKDGHKKLTYFSLDRDGTIVKEVVLGTGKYEGATEKGSTTTMGPYPTIKLGTSQNCVRQTGTYKLK
jgi:hypothetical protein